MTKTEWIDCVRWLQRRLLCSLPKELKTASTQTTSLTVEVSTLSSISLLVAIINALDKILPARFCTIFRCWNCGCHQIQVITSTLMFLLYVLFMYAKYCNIKLGIDITHWNIANRGCMFVQAVPYRERSDCCWTCSDISRWMALLVVRSLMSRRPCEYSWRLGWLSWSWTKSWRFCRSARGHAM